MTNKYYVYAYLDPRRESSHSKFLHEPFYIGRGSESRLNYHINEARKLPENIGPEIFKLKRLNMFKINKIRAIWKAGLEPIILKIHENLSMEESKLIEKDLISEIGRSIFGEGPLTNLTAGGEGRHICHAGRMNPFYGKSHSPETKAHISSIHKGKVISTEMRNHISTKLKGVKKPRKHSESRRTYMRKQYQTNPLNPIFQRLGGQNSKTWKVQTPAGDILNVTSLRKFCNDNGLNVKTLMSAYNKQRATKSGWRVLSCN